MSSPTTLLARGTSVGYGVMRKQDRVRLAVAIDLYIGDLARRGRSRATRATYERLLNDFADLLPTETYVDSIELVDYERFLARWVDASPSTLASGVSLVHGFSRFLFERGFTEKDVAYLLKRPRRKRPEELDVVTVSSDDVHRMFAATRDWQEIVCLATAVYLGARRAALSRVRRGDVALVPLDRVRVDEPQGSARFVEKGGKVITKPLPDEYVAILRAAERDGTWAGPGDYLIPSRRPASVRRSERSDKVIWNTVKGIAARAGVRAHVHALRAAFAVQYDEQHPGHAFELKELMGHARLETTLVYLRRKDKVRAMETVRDLSWGGFGFESKAEEAHTGFEPVLSASGLSEPLRRKLAALSTKTRARGERS